MPFQIDESMPWTQHYVTHGFAVIRQAVSPEFCQLAMQEVTDLCGGDPRTSGAVSQSRHISYDAHPERMTILASVYDQPGLQHIISQIFVGDGAWSGDRKFQLFVSIFDEQAQPALSQQGHIDFVNCPIPALGSGLMFQLSLVKSQPFSGNITIYPGTHRLVQKLLMDNPDWQFNDNVDSLPIPVVEPFEFVADAGDLLLFHHIVLHNGNPSHAADRSPRVAIHGQILNEDWLPESYADPTTHSPWAQSLSLNGAWKPEIDEETRIRQWRQSRASQAPR